MGAKLAVYATRAGVDDVDLVTDAYHLAMQPRLHHLPHVFHHDMLHPARTALILIENAQCRRAVVLAAAQMTESLLPALRVPAHEISALGGQVSALSKTVPDPLSEEAGDLLEKLVTAEGDVALIAVAERLDHARHLHMRPESAWRPYYEQTVAIYLPLAGRVNEDLFARFDRWARSFQRRLG
jgi:(p)ppGpp synthase/HD superfamily hydrolase